MNNPSFSRNVFRGSAVGWFLVLLLVCGAGAGYYLYRDNVEKREAARELAAERKVKEKAAREAAEKQRIKREREIREKKEKERQEAQKARDAAMEKKTRESAEAARKLREQAAQDEREKQRREELERREREEQARRQEEPVPVEEEEPEGLFPLPVKNVMPELSVYATPSKDEIPMDADKPLETWSWDKAEKMAGMEEFPTGAAPWKSGNDARRMQELLEKCREWKDAKPSGLKACPAAKDFPGVPEDGAQLVRRTVEIDSNIGGWHSTGLYAPPGAEISFSLSGAPKDSSISVRIGCHTDSLQKLDEWKRVPEITMQVPADRGRVKMANPMGGLVYVNVGQRSKRGKVFKVQISGAVPAPLFIMGKTTPEQWAAQLENARAPWGEISMPRLIVTMPLEQLKRCPDVQKAAEFLQKNMGLQDWIMGWDTKPDRLHHPMRFVVDRQISAGAGHSGYPAMGTKDWTDSIASGSIIQSGSWGLWHELGHNHQSPPFTMEGQTEVSVNIFSMVCEVMGTGKNFESCWGGGMGPYGMSAEMKKYFSGGQTYNEAPNKVQLFFWVELMYYLGFDAFRQVALQFHDKPYDNGKLSDEKKWEWVMSAFSKVTGKNMGPFFKIWRMPVSERAMDRMKNLPVWLPSKDYPACYTAGE
ncbi:M60 family metallopeptidase [Akkermansia muciniphila]|uniref:M60 family metallopeptidase n=1 Tax=Akkermansia muciniphila TaxID=239935 RepID=UPI0033B437FA